MTQEEKELLLRDICARLPYGVMVLEDIDKEFDGGCISKLATITEIKGEKMFLTKNSLTPVTIEEIRPYLRPMSSMTKEENKEYFSICTGSIRGDMIAKIDFYIKHHFDFRLTSEGLSMIEAGLALEAPEGMYNIK